MGTVICLGCLGQCQRTVFMFFGYGIGYIRTLDSRCLYLAVLGIPDYHVVVTGSGSGSVIQLAVIGNVPVGMTGRSTCGRIRVASRQCQGMRAIVRLCGSTQCQCTVAVLLANSIGNVGTLDSRCLYLIVCSITDDNIVISGSGSGCIGQCTAVGDIAVAMARRSHAGREIRYLALGDADIAECSRYLTVGLAERGQRFPGSRSSVVQVPVQRIDCVGHCRYGCRLVCTGVICTVERNRVLLPVGEVVRLLHRVRRGRLGSRCGIGIVVKLYHAFLGSRSGLDGLLRGGNLSTGILGKGGYSSEGRTFSGRLRRRKVRRRDCTGCPGDHGEVCGTADFAIISKFTMRMGCRGYTGNGHFRDTGHLS